MNYTYDANRNMLSVRDPNNVGQNCVYDALNRQTSCTDTGAMTSKSFDADNNVVTMTDAKGNNTTLAYDSRDRKTSSTDRIGGVTQWTYDSNNNLLTLTDAETQTTSYVHDVRNLKTTETYADGGVRSFTYDGAMRLSLATDQQSDTVTLSYDQGGRLLERDYRLAANSPVGAISDSDTFTYDPSSHMLSAASGRYSNSLAFTYDLSERMASEALTIGGQTYTVGRAYDTCSRLTQITYPDGTIATRGYTARDLLQSVSYNMAMVASMTYDPGMRESSRTFGNGLVTSPTYRTDNLVSAIATPGVPGFTYTYDANKNKAAETATGNLANYTWNTGGAGYDNEDRLTNWSRSNGDTQTWNLSLVGDWPTTTINSVAQTRTFAPTHEMVTVNAVPLTYDPKGNLTQRDDGRTFAWDFDNRLASTTLSGATASYTYDALGRRVTKTTGGATTVYISMTPSLAKSPYAGQEIAEYPLGTTPTSAQNEYVYGSYMDEPLTLVGGGGTYYYHQNNLHCVQAITNAAAAVVELYAYNAYGQAKILAPDGVTVLAMSSVGNPFTYTGRRFDPETALYYYRARYYDSAAGRFIGRDPVGADVNLYRYCGDNPTMYVDPSGLKDKFCWPKLLYKDKPKIRVGYIREKTWRQFLYGDGNVRVNDNGWDGSVSVRTGAWYIIWAASGSVAFDFGGEILCTSNKPNNCCNDPSQDCVASINQSGTYAKSDGFASGAIQAATTGSNNVITVNFLLGVNNAGSSAVGAGVGPFNIGITFPGSGLSQTDSMGSATWRCECESDE